MTSRMISTTYRRLPAYRLLPLAAVLVWGCQTPAPPSIAPAPLLRAATAATSDGPIMVIGGGKDQDGVMREFIRLSGGTGAPIVIVPLASDDPARSGPAYVDFLKTLGCTQVSWIAPTETPSATDRQRVASARGFFFSGGDQRRIFKGWTKPWQQALSEAWHKGATIAGTSAGAMVWGRTAILGGDAQQTAWYGEDPNHDGIRLGTGFGLLPRAVVDTHFSERGRLPRIAYAAAKQGDAVGIGVDPQTAAVIRPDGSLSVLGSGTVTVVQVPPQPIRLPLSLTGMSVSLIGSGGTWSPPTVAAAAR
jgi:cyanophycinase